MKITFSTSSLFVLGFILLLITNIVVLAGVAYNRSGEPDTQIRLTERELGLPNSYRPFKDENSGLALTLLWRVYEEREYRLFSRPWQFSYYGVSPKWLDSDKLKTLGFNTDAILGSGNEPERRKVSIPLEAYIVLEYDGDSYRRSLAFTQANSVKAKQSLASNPEDTKSRKRFENAEKWLAYEQTEASRLFAVDAGIDPVALRQQYSDPSRFIIAKGMISADYRSNNCDKPGVFGRIDRINIQSIHVPFQFRKQFDGIKVLPYVRDDDPIRPPRYAIDLAYGKRLEPWIETVRKLSDTKTELSEQEKQPTKSPK